MVTWVKGGLFVLFFFNLGGILRLVWRFWFFGIVVVFFFNMGMGGIIGWMGRIIDFEK